MIGVSSTRDSVHIILFHRFVSHTVITFLLFYFR